MTDKDVINIYDYTWTFWLEDSELQDSDYSNYRVSSVKTICPFIHAELSLATESVKTIVPTLAAAFRPYFVIAEVVEITAEVWVIDFGFRAAISQWRMPEGTIIGSFVAGDVSFGNGYYGTSYMKTLQNPASLYQRCLIKRITKKTAPLMLAKDASGVELYGIEDETQAVYEEIPALSYDFTAPDEQYLDLEAAWRDSDGASKFTQMRTSYTVYCHFVDGVA